MAMAAVEEAEVEGPMLPEEEERKGKQGGRKGRRYGLVEYRALPAYMRDNEYILRYYRCEWPLPQVLLSAFSIHNETLNVWTCVIFTTSLSSFPPLDSTIGLLCCHAFIIVPRVQIGRAHV